jgi:hypothetical protein
VPAGFQARLPRSALRWRHEADARARPPETLPDLRPAHLPQPLRPLSPTLRQRAGWSTPPLRRIRQRVRCRRAAGRAPRPRPVAAQRKGDPPPSADLHPGTWRRGHRNLEVQRRRGRWSGSSGKHVAGNQQDDRRRGERKRACDPMRCPRRQEASPVDVVRGGDSSHTYKDGGGPTLLPRPRAACGTGDLGAKRLLQGREDLAQEADSGHAGDQQLTGIAAEDRYRPAASDPPLRVPL